MLWWRKWKSTVMTQLKGLKCSYQGSDCLFLAFIHEAVIIVSAWLCVHAWVCVYVCTYTSIISGHCFWPCVQTLHLQPLNKWQIPIRTQEQKINKSREVTSGKHRACLCKCGSSFTVWSVVSQYSYWSLTEGCFFFALCHDHKSVVYTCGRLMAD